MKVYVSGRGAVELRQADFVARGGEGSVYAQGETAFKIYHDPSRAIPEGKLRALAALDAPAIIGPRDALADREGRLVGYTMRYVPNTQPLCRLFTGSFRRQHSLDTARVARLVERLREGVAHLHASDILIVDLNEMNFLVGPTFDEIYFIDVDSYQTPTYPATALMEHVRDPNARSGGFSRGSDWFSFAVITIQLFIGVHPYRGRHPTVKGLSERMKRGLSVFDPSVKLPAAAHPVDRIPEPWRGWYHDVLAAGRREPPPATPAAPLRSGCPTISSPAIASSDRLVLKRLIALSDDIALHADRNGQTCVVTGDAVYVNGQARPDAPANICALGFAAGPGHPIAAARQNGQTVLWSLQEGVPLTLDLPLSTVVASEGRLYGQSGSVIVELQVRTLGAGASSRVGPTGPHSARIATEGPPQTIVTARVVARVLERATTLYAGVALQSLLGTTYASLLDGPSQIAQVRLPELDAATGRRIVEARYARGVLMVISARAGRFDRLVFRFDSSRRTRDVRIVSDITPRGLDFVVLDTGVCVCLDEHGGLELFHAQPGSDARDHVISHALAGDVALTLHNGRVALISGGSLCEMHLQGSSR